MALRIASQRVLASAASRRYASQSHASPQLLAKLGLSEHNAGVFDGEWRDGEGDTVQSLNPANNAVLASVSQVRVQTRDGRKEGARVERMRG